jgi:tripartite-type tricarboxylate transporter receptor subunit TctC
VMGRPFVAPPGVPPERLAALREAFMATMKDPEFLADAEQAQLEIDPVDGAEVQKLVTDTYRTPPDLALEAGKMMN